MRQVTINSPERGLLLLRVRDEIRMTVDAYKALYDSSVTFGTRKQLQAEHGIPEMEGRIDVRVHCGCVEIRLGCGVHVGFTALIACRNSRSKSVRLKRKFLHCAIALT